MYNGELTYMHLYMHMLTMPLVELLCVHAYFLRNATRYMHMHISETLLSESFVPIHLWEHTHMYIPSIKVHTDVRGMRTHS